MDHQKEEKINDFEKFFSQISQNKNIERSFAQYLYSTSENKSNVLSLINDQNWLVQEIEKWKKFKQEQEQEQEQEKEKEKEKEKMNKDEEEEEEENVIQVSINDDLLAATLEKSLQEESFLNRKQDRDFDLENLEKTKEKKENVNKIRKKGQINEPKPSNQTVNPTPTVTVRKSRRLSLLSEKKSTSSGSITKTNNPYNNFDLDSLESGSDSASSSSDFKPNSGSESDHLVVSETELEIMMEENNYEPKTEDEAEEEEYHRKEKEKEKEQKKNAMKKRRRNSQNNNLPRPKDPPPDWDKWSYFKQDAWLRYVQNPNTYYYRFNEKGEQEKRGKWSEEEEKLFERRLLEFGPKDWGLFSISIPGRCGIMCSNHFRKRLLHEPEFFQKWGKEFRLIDGKLKFVGVSRILLANEKRKKQTTLENEALMLTFDKKKQNINNQNRRRIRQNLHKLINNNTFKNVSKNKINNIKKNNNNTQNQIENKNGNGNGNEDENGDENEFLNENQNEDDGLNFTLNNGLDNILESLGIETEND
ncbi:sucrose responsive element binding protein [Anaeramoeba flamelloides]|uniref:Sucrose responsive element binding protein n=1 Tax=Anaeramoeba flamelloides TaxID=1746091 RepID=A0ABQ8YZV2_9EUKA|nr:sucrose responsive element binding protein [Anaeramoeba flamelloides]